MAAKRRPPEQKQKRLPAPLGGLNALQSVLATPATDALLLDNFVIRPYGIEIRKGNRTWYNNTFAAEVRTILPYTAVSPANNKLFASTAETIGPIYDITATGAAVPVGQAVSPVTNPDIPGEWHHTMYVTPGGAFLCAVSAGAGYYTYETATGWVRVLLGGGAGQIAFPVADTSTMADLAYVMAWKNRLWFLHRNSPKAYYLPVNQITGQLTAFDFGALLSRGGVLYALSNWTYDAGDGIDDSLIVLGKEGDLLIYKGTDPASINTFGLVGKWFVGRMPAGRRGITQQGGDVWFISEYGVTPLSDHISGRVIDQVSQSAVAKKYNQVLSKAVSSNLDSKYWFLTAFYPEEVLVMGSPFLDPITGTRVSFLQSAATGGWGTMSVVEPLCAAVYEGKFFYGDRLGYVRQGFIGYRDGDNNDSSVVGAEVTARFITGFDDHDSPNANKTATRVRLLGLSDGNPSFHLKLLPEYRLQDIISTISPAALVGSLWDSAVWDSSYWLSGSQTFDRWVGVAAFGKKLALQVAIRGTGATLVTDYEVTYKEGNGL